MAIALPFPSLLINDDNVTSTYGLIISKNGVKGLEPLAPARIATQTVPGSGTTVSGEPRSTPRTIEITGVVEGTSALDLNQKLAALAETLGKTTYGSRDIYLEFLQPDWEFTGVYGGKFEVVYIGARGIATLARLAFTVAVKTIEAETDISTLASGTLDTTDPTAVFLEPTASKGASWNANAVMDEIRVSVLNGNATALTGVGVKGYFQKRFKKVVAVSSGVIPFDVGRFPHTRSVKWAAGDSHTVKYATNDDIFVPKSGEFQIFMRIKPRFVIASEATERLLFSCDNAVEGDKTKIFLTTDKKISFQCGGVTLTTPAYDFTPSIVQDEWAFVRARVGSFGQEIFLDGDGGAAGVGATSGSQPSPNDPGSHIFIGSNTAGGSPCKCDIGEVLILGTSGFGLDSALGLVTSPPMMENIKVRATEWMLFDTDFRPELGLSGVSRGSRTLSGGESGFIEQNEEIIFDMKRRKAYRIDHDDADSARNADVTSFFTASEWPDVGNLSTLELVTTPTQASVTYAITGRATAVR